MYIPYDFCFKYQVYTHKKSILQYACSMIIFHQNSWKMAYIITFLYKCIKKISCAIATELGKLSRYFVCSKDKKKG